MKGSTYAKIRRNEIHMLCDTNLYPTFKIGIIDAAKELGFPPSLLYAPHASSNVNLKRMQQDKNRNVNSFLRHMKRIILSV